MKDLVNPRIETDLRREGSASWGKRKNKKISFDPVNSKPDLDLVKSLSLIAGSKKSPYDTVLVESIKGLTRDVYYALAELKDNRGYLVVSEPLCGEINCLYSNRKDYAVQKALLCISECPAAPNTRNINPLKAYRLQLNP